MTLRIGPLSRVLDALGPIEREQALRRVTRRSAQRHDGSAIRLESAWWVLVAR